MDIRIRPSFCQLPWNDLQLHRLRWWTWTSVGMGVVKCEYVPRTCVCASMMTRVLRSKVFRHCLMFLFFFFPSDCPVRYRTPYYCPSAGQATAHVSGAGSCRYPPRSLAVRILIELLAREDHKLDFYNVLWISSLRPWRDQSVISECEISDMTREG